MLSLLLKPSARHGTTASHLDVFVQMDRFIVDVVLEEVFVHAGEEGHLRQGEDVHELLHGVSMRTLQAAKVRSETEANTTAKPDLTFTPGDSGHQHLDASPQGQLLQ